MGLVAAAGFAACVASAAGFVASTTGSAACATGSAASVTGVVASAGGITASAAALVASAASVTDWTVSPIGVEPKGSGLRREARASPSARTPRLPQGESGGLTAGRSTLFGQMLRAALGRNARIASSRCTNAPTSGSSILSEANFGECGHAKAEAGRHFSLDTLPLVDFHPRYDKREIVACRDRREMEEAS